MCDLGIGDEIGSCYTEDGKIRVTKDPSDQEKPAISEDKILWMDSRNDNWDIYICDLSLNGEYGGCLDTDEKIQITANDKDQYNPSISRDRMVWVDYRNGNSDIYMYDLSADEDEDDVPNYLETDETGGRPNPDPAEMQITADSFYKSDPIISGDLTIWKKNIYRNHYIYMCDLNKNGNPEGGGCLDTDEKTLITSCASTRCMPTTNEGKITWMDETPHTYPINGYLTIIGAPNAIPYKEMTEDLGFEKNFRALDQADYGDLQNDDRLPDISTGRIMGITSSDFSSYLARDLFYETFERTNKMKFLASNLAKDFHWGNTDAVERYASEFKEAGYNAISVTSMEYCHKFDPEEWEDQDLINYNDHGSETWAGIKSDEIPLLDNSIVINDACSTCSTYSAYSFCNRAIRQGAVAHIGMVAIGNSADTLYMNTMNGIYYEGLTLGQAFTKSYRPHHGGILYYFDTLLGDPTLNINPPYMLNEPLQ